MAEKFDPLKELANLRDTVGKTIEQGLQSITGGLAQIRIDMYEVENQVVIITEPLDGIVQDVDVDMEGDVLTFSGETRPEETPRNASYHVHERHFGPFSRSVRIPVPVKAGKAKASLKKNGSLMIQLPIDEDSDRTIRVTPVDDE